MKIRIWAIVLAILAASGAAAWLLLGGRIGGGGAAGGDPPEEPRVRVTAERAAGAAGKGAEPAGATSAGSRPARTLPPRPATGESLVVGRIAEAGTRAGIRNAAIVLRHPQGEFAVAGESKADGAFVLDRVPGVVGARVFVSAPGFGPRILRDVHVPPHDRLDVGVVELERGIPVGGRVLTMLGAPIAGAEVDLLEFSEPAPGIPQDLVTVFRELRQDDESLDQAMTAADGTFGFPGASPGRYLLAARKAGWQVRFSQPFTVVGAAAPPGIDLRLVEGRRIQGSVKDESGVAIRGAEVAALEFEPSNVFITKSQKTSTGADGRFAYSSFGSGEVALVVSAHGYSGMSRSNLLADGKEVEFVLRKAARIEGRVFDRATNKGLPGALVVAFQLSESAALEETRSGQDGAYVIEAGPTGPNVSVFAKLPGWTLATLADSMLSKDPANGMQDLEIAVGQDDFEAGAPVHRDLPMVAGGSIGGRVVDDATGEGIAGADVVIQYQSGLEFFGFLDPIQTRSTADGSFTAPSIGAGKATVSAAAEGYLVPSDAKPPDEEQAARNAEGEAVDIPPGGAVTGFTIRLRRGLDVVVLVTDPDGAPTPGAIVSWVMPEEELINVFGPTKRPRATPTDSSGKARLRGVAPRPGIVVAARHPGFPAGGHATIDLSSPPREAVTVVLVRGATVAGVVLDADGKPAADRRVVFRPEQSGTARAFGEWPSAGHHAVTDSTGKFVIESLAPGAGTIGVEPGSRGGETEERDDCLESGWLALTLVAGKREDVRLQIVRALAITGTVFDATGKRLANITINAGPEGIDVGWNYGGNFAQTGDDGTYRLGGLCPGSYRVHAAGIQEAPDKESEVLTRTVRAGTAGVDFRFTK